MSAAETTSIKSLLPRRLHQPAALVMALCTGLFVWLANRVAGHSQAGSADRWVTDAVHAVFPSATTLIVNLIALGDALPVIIIAMGLCSLALVLGQRRVAVLAIVGPLLTGLTTTGVKPLVGRIIRGSLAYPSGHTGAWTSLGLVAALVLIGLVSASALTSAVILASGAVLAGATMATALILSGDHYPSDTVGGFCAALVCVLGCVLLIERIAAPSSRHRVRVEGYVPENED